MGERWQRARREYCTSGIGIFVFYLGGLSIAEAGLTAQTLSTRFDVPEEQGEGGLPPVLLPDSFREELGDSVNYLYQDEDLDLVLISHTGRPGLSDQDMAYLSEIFEHLVGRRG